MGRVAPHNVLLALAATLVLATAAVASQANVKPVAGERAAESLATTTPIKHVVVILGENHTFDNVFATYVPPSGQHVRNLLSEGVVTAAGTPGPHVQLAAQRAGSDTGVYTVRPRAGAPYAILPRPDTTTATGLPADAPDTRFPARLPNAPYQITRYAPYSGYVGDPIHRFFQMWQSVDGGRADLFTWVHQAAGGDDGTQTHQGALDMGFYNVQDGDAPLLASLARRYVLADNYHQAVMGGSGPNHFALGTGDVAVSPAGAGEIDDPNPAPGTNDRYLADGRLSGSYVACADPSQPGVASIRAYLRALPYRPFRGGDCDPGRYYVVNNAEPAYVQNAAAKPEGATTAPPQTVPTVADELDRHGISWAYYGQGWNDGSPTAAYCDMCNPFQYSKSVMSDPARRRRIQDLPQFDAAARLGALPAVSFLKPDATDDGHPASSSLDLFEEFASRAVHEVMANARLASDTAILIVMDDGGGYYDSGYVQTLDFFGDGTRVPMVVVSRYARRGAVDHTYYDHASVLKFIERNWSLRPLSARSLDSLPDPVSAPSDPYVPANRPAVGDLMGMFDFSRSGAERDP